MEIYLVGGAIRDRLLGLPIKERDWVVVGGSPEALIAAGYQPVGKDFPVFLHPETHEEYALARTERKTAKGYKGFVFHTSPDVTLKEDLKRRDLTINAIAESESGDLIDPYHGQADLKRKVLRHISPAFSEDPVRILRLARFAAKLPDFSIHPETNQLMQKMVKHGEVDALVAERVWQECSRALQEPATERFFEVLSDCHALPILFPMISLHSKGFCALKKTKNPQIRFSVLLHDIERDQLNTLCKRYRVPKAFSELACLTQAHHIAYTNILTASPEALLRFIKKTDAIRRPDRFALFLKACATLPIEVNHKAHKERLERAIVRLKNVDIPSLQKQGLQGKAFVNALEKMQINCLQDL